MHRDSTGGGYIQHAVTSLSSCAVCCLALLPVQAAEVFVTPSAASTPQATDDALEEVVVTARKRAESLQQVPISAAVVNGAALQEQNVATLQDLTNTLPSVKLAKGSGTDRQFIRGVGSGDNASFEQSVGTFIDDIYHGRARSSEASLFDVERVEVLKGPQTTYFGNNAIAGALNIVTRDPGASVAGDARLSYTPKFNGYTGAAALDLPASATFAVRLAGQLSGGDGWVSDVGIGDDTPRTRNSVTRGTFVWKPTEDFTARVKVQYGKENQHGGLPIVRGNCPPPAVFGAPSGFCAAAIGANAGPLSDDFARNTNAGQFTYLRTDDYLANLSLDRSAFTLTSVTGYSHYDYALGTDLDLTPLTLLQVAAPEDYHQFSQELRIISSAEGAVEYIAGLYYQQSTLNGRNTFSYSFLTPNLATIPAFQPLLPFAPFGAQSVFREESDTYSAFGALTWKPVEQLKVTGALRYSVVDKDFVQRISVGTGNATYAPLTPFPTALAPLGQTFASAVRLATAANNVLARRDNHLSPSLSVQYDVNSDVMVYARFDHGFKAGGFNGVDLNGTAATLPFSEETVDAFEIGAKTSLFDGRAILNADVFRSKYEDLQLAGVVPSSAGAYVNRVQNAGGAISRGIEIDATWRVTQRLRTSLAATFLDSHYTSYPNATPTALQTRQGIPVQDLSGQDTPFAPELSGSWTLSYSGPLRRDLTWRIENRVFASRGFFLNFNNDRYVRQDAYAREDLTLALASEHGWEVSVTGQNLTDETIRTYGAALPATLGTYAFITELPRNVFVQLRYSF